VIVCKMYECVDLALIEQQFGFMVQ